MVQNDQADGGLLEPKRNQAQHDDDHHNSVVPGRNLVVLVVVRQHRIDALAAHHSLIDLQYLAAILSNAPVGKHPDETADGKIRMNDGSLVEGIISMAEGATDDDPAEVIK